MLDLLRSSFRSLFIRKFRTLLTVLGVSIGVLSVVVISCIGQCGTGVVTSELESLGLNGITISVSQEEKAYAPLGEDELDAVLKCDEVEEATPVLMQTTDVSTKRYDSSAFVWGIDTTAEKIISIQVIHGRMLQLLDIQKRQHVCLVDESFAEQAYGRKNIIGKTITIQGISETREYEVVGIVKTGTGLLQNFIGEYIPTFVYVPYTTFQDVLGRTGFDQIAVELTETKDVDKAGEAIISSLNEKIGLTEAYVSNDLAKQRASLMSMMDIVTLILTAVGGISLVVASLSIMTIMLVSVSERTREIGIKKAVGASRGIILTEFLLEAAFISAVGCVVGLGIGYTISFIGAGAFGIQLTVDWSFIAGISLFSLVCGMVFGIYPAIKASRLKPVDALRME